MDPVIKKAFAASQKGQSFAFATIIENSLQGTPRKSGAKMIVLSDGSITGTIGGGVYEKQAIDECRKAIRARKSKLLVYENFGKKGQPICGGKFSIFIEPFAGTRRLIICGAGHIALPLSMLGKILNFHVTILDDRKAFANKKRFPHVDKVITGNPPANLSKIKINENTYIVIVTHGHQWDFSCLKKVINSKAAYIGVIGSKTKRAQFFNQFSARQRARITMPIGLDIGAQTPEEIAIAIAAEIIGTYNQDQRNSPKFAEKNQA